MVSTKMTESRAREILAAYGGDPARWPRAERGALRRAIRRDPALAAAAREARALDRALAADDGRTDSSRLEDAILARAPAPAAPIGFGGRIPAFAASAALIAGAVLGFGGALATVDTADPTESMLASAFASSDDMFDFTLDTGA